MSSSVRYANRIFGGDYGEDVDTSRWVVIYPPYIDSTRKVSEGRKINKDKCVKQPNMQEIFESVKLTGLKTQVEPEKAYCRDYWARGRIRVCLFDSDGKPLNEEIPNRRALFSKVAALIPKYREKTKNAQAKGNANSSGAKSTGTKKKKKGKR